MLVVYGSLFPWHFESRPLPDGPLWYLLGRWDTTTNSYLVHDIGINIALYAPLGLAAHVVFAESGWPMAGFYGPVLLALGLAFPIELLQAYEPGRESSMVDVLADCSGAATGVVLAVFLKTLLPRVSRRLPLRVHPAVAWVSLVCLAGLRFLPHRFTGSADKWRWIPFGALLAGKAEAGLMLLAVKWLACSAVILLFRLSGWRAGAAIGCVTAAAALIFPGITDPAIALLAGYILITLSPGTETRSQSAE